MIFMIGEKVWDQTRSKHELFGTVISSFRGTDQRIMTRIRKENGEVVIVAQDDLSCYYQKTSGEYKNEGEEAFTLGKMRRENPYTFPSMPWESWDTGYMNPVFKDGLEDSSLELQIARPL